MLFNSIEFIFIFLPIAFFGYHILRRWTSTSVSIAFLIFCSAIFYAVNEPIFLFLLFGSTIFNYLFGMAINATRSKVILSLGIIINLVILGYFKYYGFIIWSFNKSFSGDIEIPDIALPLAISFFTFQQIAYLVDVFRYGVQPGGMLRYTIFVVFFPQLIAGPIVHHSEMIPQFKKVGRLARLKLDFAVGATIFSIGLGKKVILADSCAVFSDIVFSQTVEGAAPGLLESWIGAIAFGLQIYFDFSGYSDMAVGLARLFGIRLPINFFSPYRSDNIIDFWRRWHITLSRFLRDYLYFPLGGNRKGSSRRYVNIMVVMLLGGFWHGAGINFVFWGALHGGYLIINHFWRVAFPTPPGAAKRALFRLLTLIAVMFAWVPFRAPDFETTIQLWSGMSGSNGISLPRTLISGMGEFGGLLLGHGVRVDGDIFQSFYNTGGGVNAAIFAASGLIALFIPNTYQWVRRLRPALNDHLFLGKTLPKILEWRPTILWAILIAALFIATFYYQEKPNPFLYFQF